MSKACRDLKGDQRDLTIRWTERITHGVSVENLEHGTEPTRDVRVNKFTSVRFLLEIVSERLILHHLSINRATRQCGQSA